jgi:dinuclear metal center YbgI/SA1388 family protein
MIKISDILKPLQEWAPLSLAENYDNVGLLTGTQAMECTGVLICLDVTQDVVDEAKLKGCNLIISHHPIWFGAKKSLLESELTDRIILKAIKNDICLYSIHTNLDNTIKGVNAKIGEKLNLSGCTILKPLSGKLIKLETFVPHAFTKVVADALFEAGAGNIGNYDECSFFGEGIGTFRPNEQANPFEGTRNQRSIVNEVKMEFVLEDFKRQNVWKALRDSHPYEEIAFQFLPTLNALPHIGAGMVGFLPEPVEGEIFLELVKSVFKCGGIRYSGPANRHIRKVAVCGGSGSFLIKDALNQGADAFVTADISYHKFFENEDRMLLMDIGHYESEQFTIQLISEHILQFFPKFAVHLTEVYTNPVRYYS